MSEDRDYPVCPECGARVEPHAEVCELCGTPLTEEGALPFEEKEALEVEAREAPLSGGSSSVELPVCPTCGWENPADARFCNQCGSRLVRAASRMGPHVPDAPVVAPVAEKSRSASNAHLYWWAGIALVLVGLLFAAKVLTEKPPVAAEAEPVTTEAGVLEKEPVPVEISSQVEQLQQAIARAPDTQTRIAQMRALVRLYGQSRLFVRAAELQREIAETLNTPEEWAMLGHLYYDGMQLSQGKKRVLMARNAIAAYQRSLELDPDNLDVRTDMAVAYLNDPDNPMEAIRQINIVLERNPDHLQANFNKGIMLAQIGRIEQAITHFEKVKQLSEPGSEPYERAQQMIDALQQSGKQ